MNGLQLPLTLSVRAALHLFLTQPRHDAKNRYEIVVTTRDSISRFQKSALAPLCRGIHITRSNKASSLEFLPWMISLLPMPPFCTPPSRSSASAQITIRLDCRLLPHERSTKSSNHKPKSLTSKPHTQIMPCLVLVHTR